MIDLHCHLLPGIDDGSASLEMSLDMARIALADGITATACTPHIYPGLFDNRGPDIRRRVAELASDLEQADLGLHLTFGADIQVVPELVAGLKSGLMPTLGGSRYFLFEPPHHTVPLAFAQSVYDALAAGYVPLITHPERLTWLDDDHYPWFVAAARNGAWVQITAGAVVGRFGRKAKYWSERFLDDGLVHVLATDAREPVHRPPVLSEGLAVAETWVGAVEARRLVLERPAAVLDNLDPHEIAQPPGLAPGWKGRGAREKDDRGWLARLLGR
jgi:protein-tyrosine phosphatase